MVELKIRKFGNSLGVVLPKEVIDRLRAGDGERLFLIEAPDGDYRLLLGLYSFKTGARATAQIGGATGDTVELENVFCRAGRCADEVVGATP